MRLFSFLLLLLSLLLAATGCSQTSLLTKHDYAKSQASFLQGNANDAQLDLPGRAEQGTFIASMESGYLSLIRGKAEITALQRQAQALQHRVRYHVSREAKTFFYLQTPEDYYASEHEVIWLHMLLSWGYSLQGRYENACVEARIASSLLSLPWSPLGHFDDPTLRLFLASLWTLCGDWREAQVDLRAAWIMDNSLTWAKELASRERAPAHLFVVLGGPGPDVVWAPELSLNPLRSQRKVSFKLRGQKSPLTLADRSGVLLSMHLSPDAGNWYARHVARESELHEVILDSAYGGNAALSSAIATAKITASTGLGLGIGAGGSALGTLAIYLGLRGNNENLVVSGAGIVAASIREGLAITRQGYEVSTSELNHELDPSEHYRFVRYLPEYLWLGWSDQAVAYPLTLRTPLAQSGISRPTLSHERSSVSIAHLPDAGETQPGY